MSAQFEWGASTSLVDLLLAEQKQLTAVDEFSAYHESTPLDSGRYESLIPSSLPGSGQQFAFRVDLDACTGCKACVTACHNLNGLEEGETWRSVGLIEGDSSLIEGDSSLIEGISSAPSEPECGVHQQTVTAACHHCEDPACLSGCPVRAYEKDAATGIVRHLDDQCIGCRYCQLMCPYDVPTYSERLGIVRKCDMCHDRLSQGEAPACVQGCPNEAISIAIVESAAPSSEAPLRMLDVSAGSMPASNLTRPTTRYISKRPSGEILDPVGLTSPRPAEGHAPLAAMLVLTQASIGMLCFDAGASLISRATISAWSPQWVLITLATAIGLLGLAASFAHLGRPLWAFRAVLGLRTSWMSREILVLGGFAGLLVAACVMRWLGWGLAMGRIPETWTSVVALGPIVAGAAAVVGLAGLYCSVQIYAVTGRPLWRFDRTLFRFLSTAIWAGLAAAPIGLLEVAESTPVASPTFASSPILLAGFVLGLMGFTVLRLQLESTWLLRASAPEESLALARSTRLLETELASAARLRRRGLAVAGLGLPALLLITLGFGAPIVWQMGLAGMVLVGGIASDGVERSLFFRSEAMPSMPGVG